MALSSNSIIHFTQEKSRLQGILNDNFKIKYCLETINLGDDQFSARVPMVSFCDIPLSQIKDHITKYGRYGIGLTKEWAVKNGLNPVLYIEPQSHLAKSYNQAFEAFVLDKKADFGDTGKAIADVLRYVKNYEGQLDRNGMSVDRYRYSDEREWRYVPPYNDDCSMLTSNDYYIKNKKDMDAEVDPLRLHFEPNDIKYIIIESDAEISEFIDLLKKAKGKNYSYHDVERLTTRILTTEQIMADI